MSCLCGRKCHRNEKECYYYGYSTKFIVSQEDVGQHAGRLYYGGRLDGAFFENRDSDKIAVSMKNEQGHWENIIIDLKSFDYRTHKTLGDIQYTYPEPEYHYTKTSSNVTNEYNRKRLVPNASGGYSVQNWTATETTPIIKYEKEFVGFTKKIGYHKNQTIHKKNDPSYIAYVNPQVCYKCSCDKCYIRNHQNDRPIVGDKCLICHHTHQDIIYCSFIEENKRCKCLYSITQKDIDTKYPPFTILEKIYYTLTCQLTNRIEERNRAISLCIDSYHTQ